MIFFFSVKALWRRSIDISWRTYQEGNDAPLSALPLEAALNVLQRIQNGHADSPHAVNVAC